MIDESGTDLNHLIKRNFTFTSINDAHIVCISQERKHTNTIHYVYIIISNSSKNINRIEKKKNENAIKKRKKSYVQVL